MHDHLSTGRHVVRVSFITNLKSNLRKALNTKNTTGSNFVSSHAHDTTALQSNVFLSGITLAAGHKRVPRQRSRYSDWLRAGQSGERIPSGARVSAPVQIGPGAHPASCTIGTGSFPGVKRPGCRFDGPPTSSAEVYSLGLGGMF
jgi:hypothetical protein